MATALEFDARAKGRSRLCPKSSTRWLLSNAWAPVSPSAPIAPGSAAPIRWTAPSGIKEKNPDARVFILYRDIRTYGVREDLYRRARELGVLFIRYDLEHLPQVSAAKATS